MPHPSQFKSKGGKKGPRQVTSKRQPKVSLKPAPARSAGSAAPADDYPGEHDDEDDEDDSARYGYREALQGEAKPLEGLNVSVSGCAGRKEDLLELAVQYGAQRHGGLQEDTTHLVTDRPEGQKYQVALARRMHVMQPEWLEAVREAWIAGEQVDWEQLEEDYVMPPLFNVVACLTHFAHGDYKEDFKQLLLSAGALVTNTLDSRVTHLIVASPSSPHSQTQSSEKLKWARSKSAAPRLHPELQVVWEGWAREAVQYGGRRAERDEAWKQDGPEPVEDVRWAVKEAAPRSGHAARKWAERAPAQQKQQNLPPPSASQLADARKRTLVAAAAPSTSTKPHSFQGYDSSLLDAAAETNKQASTSAVAAAAFDTSNGKVVKKRRRVGGAPSGVAGGGDDLLEAFGASQQHQGGSEQSRFADADTTLPLPPPAALLSHSSRQQGGEDDDVEMALELVPGEAELQYQAKSRSVIKALAAGREGSFLPDSDLGAGGAAGRRAKKLDVKPAVASVAGVGDDSAFFDGPPPQILEDDPAADSLDLNAVIPATQARSSSSPSNEDEGGGEVPPIFEGKTFAVLGLTGGPLASLKEAVAERKGRVVDGTDEEQLKTVDWIVLDHLTFYPALSRAADPRIVTICWLEHCLWREEISEPNDTLLLRPLPYAVPVPGLENLTLHFSGLGAPGDPPLHFAKRFTQAIGANFADAFDRTVTHLVCYDLDLDPSLSPDDLDGEANPKVGHARRWGKEVVSLKWLRERVEEMAREVEEAREGAREDKRRREEAAKGEGKGKGKGKAREVKKERGVREITNEMDEPMLESVGGPLSDCVVFFSPKIEIDRKELGAVVQDLGGTAARQYSDSVTHLVHCGPKSSESFKEFRLAKKADIFIVHPRWVEECGRTASHVSEGDFPHTFDARKGGQLFDMGMTVNPTGSPRGSPTASRHGSAAPSPSLVGGGAQMARSPSKLSLGGAASCGSPPTAERGAKKRPLDLEEEEENGQQPSPPPSPSPRRRRSDTTATEVVEEAVGEEQEAPASPSSSSPRKRALLGADSEPTTIPSSDPFEIPPLASELRSPGGGGAGKTQLRQQTTLLMAQFMEAPVPEKGGRKSSRTNLARKKSSNTSNHSVSTRFPPLDGADTSASLTRSTSSRTTSPTSLLAAAAAVPAGGSSRFGAGAFDPTQATQDEESMYVVYDNPEEAAAREQIQRALRSSRGAEGSPRAGAKKASPAGARTGSPASEETQTPRRRSTRTAVTGKR
ncbi:hypothetical protein JCM8097_000472 [Rhodosporidiobolus ruineniae]